jgi:hypothetical protein
MQGPFLRVAQDRPRLLRMISEGSFRGLLVLVTVTLVITLTVLRSAWAVALRRDE